MSDFEEMMRELEILLRTTGDESSAMLLKLPEVLARILAFLQSEDVRFEKRFQLTEEKLDCLIAKLREYLIQADDRQQLGRSLVEERARIMHLERVNGPLKSENAQLKGANAQLAGENAQLKTENAQLKTENAQLKNENAQLRVSSEENARIADSFSHLTQRLEASEAALVQLKRSRVIEMSGRLSSKVPELVATARAATEQAQNEVANIQHEITIFMTKRQQNTS